MLNLVSSLPSRTQEPGQASNLSFGRMQVSSWVPVGRGARFGRIQVQVGSKRGIVAQTTFKFGAAWPARFQSEHVEHF